MAETEPNRERWPLATLAGLFTLLMVTFFMWPRRHTYATLAFWAQAVAMAAGALAIFVLLVAGWREGAEILRAFLRQGGDSGQPPSTTVEGSAEGAEESPSSNEQWQRSPIPVPPDAPRPPATFRGREDELHELREAISEGGGVVITGPDGVGKTALALKLVEQLTPDDPDAQIFIDLGATTTPLTPVRVMGQVIYALHAGQGLPLSLTARAQLCRWMLHDEQVLLLLDDAADAEQVRALVPPTACALVITSRQPLPLPGVHTLELGPLSEEAAGDLLHVIAPCLDVEVAATLAELCGHVPLALELTARALATGELEPNDLVQRLEDGLEHLDPLQASLSLSYDLLDEGLRRLWRRLSVFSIPFEEAGAAAASDMTPDNVREGLEQLVARGLLVWRETSEHYRLHDLARKMAYAKLQALEDPRPAHRRVARYLQEELHPERGLTAPEMLEAADQWERGEAWESFAHGTTGLIHNLYNLGYEEAIETRLERALAAVEEHLDDPKLTSTLLHDLGVITAARGAPELAIERYQRSISISKRTGDAAARALTELTLGGAYVATGEPGRAVEIYPEVIETMRSEGLKEQMAQAYVAMGLAYADQGDLDRARKAFDEGIKAFEDQDDLLGLADAWGNLAELYAGQGAWKRAIACYQEEKEASKRLGYLPRVAKAWYKLGQAYADQGAWEKAVDAYQRGLVGKRWLRDVHGVAAGLQALGQLHARMEAWEQATACYRESLQIYRRIGSDQDQAIVWSRMGEVSTLQGQWDQAVERYRESLKAAEAAGDLVGQARAFGGIGLAHREKGALDETLEALTQSMAILERLGDTYNVAVAQVGIANIHLQAGRIEDAKPLLRHAYVVFAHHGSPHADGVAQALVEACGSLEAANDYLAQVFTVHDVD